MKKINNLGKKVISLALLGSTSSLMAMYGQHAYLYNDARIMGMGGANVAVGAYSTSVFSNPAGLTNIKKDHGFVVDIIGLGVSITADAQTFVEDLDDADTDTEIVDVLAEYDGQHFHIGVDNYTSISKNSDLFAWTIGLLAAADINYMSHAKGSVDASVLGTSSRGYGGVVLGAAKPYDTAIGRVDVGMSLKYISLQSYEGGLGVSELLEDDVGEAIQDKLERTATGIGVDIGIVAYPIESDTWKPAFGLSIMNMGSIDMDDMYGGQPMTVNLGASITPDVPILDKLVIAVDYVDLLNANKVRFYNVDGSYTDEDESDFMKRLRLGVGIGLIDTSFFSTTLNLGMYQSAYTAGLDMELLFLKLNFATYEEEIGSGSVSSTDRRYMAKIGIGW